MNRAQRNRNQRRRPQGRRSAETDLWRVPAPLPELEPIANVVDPGAMLRSLGDPPMTSGNVAGHYFSFVVIRSAAVATALAWSAGLVADDELVG